MRNAPLTMIEVIGFKFNSPMYSIHLNTRRSRLANKLLQYVSAKRANLEHNIEDGMSHLNEMDNS